MTNYNLKSDRYSSHNQIARYIGSAGATIRILDLGCDRGFLGTMLTQQGKNIRIEGTDIDKKKLKLVGNNYAKTYLFDLNATHWPVKGKYDVVVLADTIEHLQYPSTIIEKSVAVLKPGGRLIISIPNSVHWWARLVILSGNFPQHQRGIFDATHIHFYTQKTFRQLLLCNTHLRIEKEAQTTMPFQFIFGSFAHVFPIPTIYTLSYFLAKAWPGLFAYQHIFITKKID